MKKQKVKGKGFLKEAGSNSSRGQVVKFKTGKSKINWTAKLSGVKTSLMGVRQFLLEALQELYKVTWPGRKETLGVTAVVLFLVLVISVFLGLVDLGLTRLVRLIIK
jgi:preprotein translocase subunit SecE